MVGITTAALDALAVLFTWPNVLFLLLGTVVGITFGAIPGLGGVVALTLLIPPTFGMDLYPVMILFGATMGGVVFGGSISAILLNTPGTPPNAATCMDGYPLARMGRAGEALGIAAMASAAGAVFGDVILIALIPVAQEFIFAFTPPEFFWLGIFGLSIIAVASEGPLLKGLIAGGLGLMVSFVGFSNVGGVYRYGFGTEFLWDGIGLLPALVGIFAIAEVINLGLRRGTVAQEEVQRVSGGVLKGVREVFRHPGLFLRSSVIGVLVGMVPGVGGTVGNFIAYGHAVQIDDEPESFGRGNVKGVIASEASNDAKDGGTLLPTVVFGIPGGSVTAVLLAAFSLHGLETGQTLLSENLNVLFILIFSLIFANVLTSAIGLGTANYLARLTRVSTDLLIPAILAVSVFGTYAYRNHVGDVVIAVAFGFLAALMVYLEYSRVALILGLILGPIVERYFFISRQMSTEGYAIFFTRPLSIGLILLTVLGIALPILRARRRQAALSGGPSAPDAEERPWLGARSSIDAVDLAFAAALVAVLGYMVVQTLGFDLAAKRFPLVVGSVTLVFLVALVARTVSPRLAAASERFSMEEAFGVDVDFSDTGGGRTDRSRRRDALAISAWVLLLLVAVLLVGLLPGTLAFLVAFYYRRAELGWRRTALYTAAVWAALFVLFQVVLRLPLYRGVLAGLVGG